MVHRSSDSRLLNSLLSNEKDYHKQLLVLMDNYSRNSLGAFSAYASASPAPIAHAVIAVAGSFAGADDALPWQTELHALKELEEEVGNVIRDREILFVRPIFLPRFPRTKNPRDSFIGTLGSSVGDSSQISLNSFTSPGASSSKFGATQAELQAYEAHLAAKEKEFDELQVTALQHGLEA
ncbi:hypothetical protein BJV78DRAFT_1275252 [Lactifluus subvellereus]|nr:hypothetical protein BJV78DRAFT_1275252 [Lactifluus subvellereus]